MEKQITLNEEQMQLIVENWGFEYGIPPEADEIIKKMKELLEKK